VDDVVIVGVLQRSSNLKDDRQNAEQRLGCTLLKYLLDGSSWSIVHRQERPIALPIEIQGTHDMPVLKFREQACFKLKANEVIMLV